jgi:hypothetical protein
MKCHRKSAAASCPCGRTSNNAKDGYRFFFHRKLHLMFIPGSLRFRRVSHRSHSAKALRAEGPKPRSVMRGSHAGARSFERSSTPEPFRDLGSRRGAAQYADRPSHRSPPAYRTGESPEKERGSRLRRAGDRRARRIWLQTGPASWRGSSKPRAALLARHFVACARSATQNRARPLLGGSRGERAYMFGLWFRGLLVKRGTRAFPRGHTHARFQPRDPAGQLSLFHSIDGVVTCGARVWFSISHHNPARPKRRAWSRRPTMPTIRFGFVMGWRAAPLSARCKLTSLAARPEALSPALPGWVLLRG